MLCHAFGKFKVAGALLWLDRIGMPRKIGQSVVAYWKEQTRERIEANPYSLVSFEASWKRIDAFARARFGVAENDPRRLCGAAEEVLYGAMKQGHTCLPLDKVLTRLSRLLGRKDLAELALSGGAGSIEWAVGFRLIDGYCQPNGTALIESYLARRLHEMVAGENEGGQACLFAQIAKNPRDVNRVIADFEEVNRIALSAEQNTAVRTSAATRLSLILGGAGTGKTTVLKALYEVLDEQRPGAPIYQLALAGRAAQRMADATGRTAMTIAAFLAKIEPAQIEVGSVIVVDEVSMVDAILMYRLLRHIPSGVRLILVGDPSQLPPIGPGLVLHALEGLSSIPQTELKVVKRQTASSGIPQVAAAIRCHRVPRWTDYSGKGTGVYFMRCGSLELEQRVQSIYEDLGGTGRDYAVQILSITKAGLGGVRNINVATHNRFQADAEPVLCLDPEFGTVVASTLDRVTLHVGDLVIHTENDYSLGLRNGSLGRIVRAIPVSEPDAPCCLCEFDGEEYLLNSSQILALNHAYAITVHKSQGSQFQRVVVPVRTSRLLDQTLIYTAVTRGVEQVVLVGDLDAADEAIRSPASAARRHIALPKMLAEQGSDSASAVVAGAAAEQPDCRPTFAATTGAENPLGNAIL